MIVAIIAAAGMGSRMGSKLPKQYLAFKDKSILYHSILPFYQHNKIDKIFCIIAKNDINLYQDAIADLQIEGVIFGGKERQDSIRIALEQIKDLNPKKILIHDAARPFINKKIIDNLIIELNNNQAVIPAIKISDTIKEVKNNFIIKTIPRENIYLAQTPQAFDYNLIYSLHQKYKDHKFTDDAALCEYENMAVKIISGDNNNFKITNKQDYDRAKKQFN